MATQINYLNQEYIITKPMQIADEELNNFLVHIIQNSEHRVDLHKHGLKWSFFSAKMFDDSAPSGSVVLGLYIGDSTLPCSKIEEIINGVAVAEASFAAMAKTPIDDSSTAIKPLEKTKMDEPNKISDKQLDAILYALNTHCVYDEQLKAIADDIREKRTNSEFLLQTDIDAEQYAVKISDDVWVYSENSDRSTIGKEVPYDPYVTEVMEFSDYTEEQLEHWICAYMPSLQAHKDAYGDDWKQIALECVFEQTSSYCNA